MQITAIDEVFGSQEFSQLLIEWRANVPVTLRFLIEERVRLQWENNKRSHLNREFIPDNSSTSIDQQISFNTPLFFEQKKQSGSKTLVSAVAEAFESFAKNGFFVIIDGKQICELDAELRLSPKSDVRFVRLVQLVGG